MKQGYKVKLPSWGGYWYWDPNKDTVMMRTKDDEVLDIRETQVVAYTLLNVVSDEWVIADETNLPVLGGVATFNFGEAIKYLKRGIKVARQGWNGKGMYITLIPSGNAMFQGFDMQDCIGMKTANDKMQPGWLASQADLLADDWMFAE